MYASSPVPQKGIDSDEYSTRRVLRFLEFLGYRDLVLKSDQKAALGKVLRHAKAHRGEGTQTMTEESPVKDSQSNGSIERSIQTVERQARTLKLALENCIGRKLEVGPDGRNPYPRLRGKKMKQPLVEFGESVHFLIPDHGSLRKGNKSGGVASTWAFAWSQAKCWWEPAKECSR